MKTCPGGRRRAPWLNLALLATALATTATHLQAEVTFSNLYSFTNGDYTAAPEGLVQGSDGNFYGTTDVGGANGYGAVFRISASGVFTNLYSFTGGDDGRYPNSLAAGSDGNMYGTTGSGGTNDDGTVFKITTNGTFTNFYSFIGGTNGAIPAAPPIQGCDGSLYGTTQYTVGYIVGFGTVYKISTNGTLTTLCSFTGGNDGGIPEDELVQGSDGNLYGTTQRGGSNNCGTVFKISPGGTFTSLYSFTNGTDGEYPDAGLVQGVDGYFYGTTLYTDTNDYGGTVFKISPSGAVTTLHSFTGGNDGSLPINGLVQGSDGNFYGTTFGGGTNDDGTVFKISPSGTLTTLYSFTGGNDGANPGAGLVQGSDGNFYGTAFSGGTDGIGIVFRLSVGLSSPLWIPVNAAFGFNNDGLFGFDAAGPAGMTAIIQSSPDLQNWTSLQTNMLSSSGLFYFSDSQSPNNSQQFYRAVSLLP